MLLLVALVPAPGRAQAREMRLDHAGSVGLVAGAGAEGFELVPVGCPGGCKAERASAGLVEVGGTVGLGEEGSELSLRLRLVRLTGNPGESVLLGYRGYFGREAWKGFFDIDLQGTLRPAVMGGARIAVGGMHELSPLVGLWLSTGASFGIGEMRRAGVEILAGVQLRSYLLE